jgi:hypothetical protein
MAVSLWQWEMGGFTLSIKPAVLTRVYTTAIDNRLTTIVMALEDRKKYFLMFLLFAQTVQGATQEVNTDIQKMLFVSLVPNSVFFWYNVRIISSNSVFLR